MTTTDFPTRLEAVMLARDPAAARALLDGLDEQGRREAREWVGRRGEADAMLTRLGAVIGEGEHDRRFAVGRTARWIVATTAVWVLGPVMAAKRVPWWELWDYHQDPGEHVFVRVLCDLDRDDAAAFVEAASHVPLGQSARNCQGVLARVLRAAAVHHGLPCPTGVSFLGRWWAGTKEGNPNEYRVEDGDLADRLAADPLMPDLLPLYLASGECGTYPTLPAVVAELVERGVVDRAAPLDHVLRLLTAPQRPASQRVLGGIATALHLTLDEVPGGLVYLLGVLATADRSVAASLLPLALEAVSDGPGLEDLARVVAARPDKKPRTVLLSALRRGDLVERAGREAALAALAALRTGEDAAFDASVDAVRASLGDAPADKDEPAVALGLWDLEPRPGVVDLPWGDDWPRSFPSPSWRNALRTGARNQVTRSMRAIVVEQTLTAMASGEFDGGADLLEAVRELLAERRLAVRDLREALDALFLGGGLRQGWPAALSVVDEVCGAAARPSGTADLLRTMARHAAEVPPGRRPPPHLLTLAGSPGNGKAVAEARALVDALGGGRSAGSDETAPVSPPVTGLWERQDPQTYPPLPEHRRTPPMPDVEPADEVRWLLAGQHTHAEYRWSDTDVAYRPPGHGDQYARSAVTGPDRSLAITTAAVRRHGGPPVRAVLEGLASRYPAGDVVAAVDVWASGVDPAVFWRVAHGRVATESDLLDRLLDGGLDRARARRQLEELPRPAERLRGPDDPRVDAVVLPSGVESPLERLAFLRALEALLVAEDGGVLLATATWADGTLDLDDLLGRLAEARDGHPLVGPLDLVQALHRLRPADARRASEVPDGVRTDPRFTDPNGVRSLDAGELVRTWLRAGGLPALTPVLDEDGRWTGAPTAPVPFSTLAALPEPLRTDPWCPGRPAETARVFPRWADRTVTALGPGEHHDRGPFPGHLHGPFGLPLHARLLQHVEASGTRPGVVSDHAVEFAAHGRLEPALLARGAELLLDARLLGVGRLGNGLAALLEHPGAFRWWWPAGLAVVDAFCARPRRSSQLAALVRLLAATAHEVPRSAVDAAPPGVAGLAAATGSSAAHRGARDLVAALDGRGAGS
ncbi:hypothetical protein [Phycicoccus flavus]|uniref:hypothetical protein n=1 Tax=Phycicoccus flavus TaxID=2502783 RepID=UPI000FEBE6FE|nr:hypothetical protein [Phycicoccus flavus]NHA67973.1 hypothetical protein [Phycicoccus flavus]